MPSPLSVPLSSGDAVSALVYEAVPASAVLLLGHGAGAGQSSPFMVQFAEAMAARGITSVTFNFLYMERRKKVPDPRPVLEDCYRRVVEAVRREVGSRLPLFVGGKSMGGRIASQIAAGDAALPIQGLVLLGYPLHPPGRPDKMRDAHLPEIKPPVLFVQGSRDAFGTPSELAPVLSRMMPSPTLHVVEGGDHSFKVSKGGAAGQLQTITGIHDTVAAWIESSISRNPGILNS